MPADILNMQPWFSWLMRSEQQGALQVAYRLLVVESSEKLATCMFIYDRGEILSNRSVGATINET